MQIECCDALRIIKSRDTADTFFYIAPSYVGAYQCHYDGYTQNDFDTLLSVLENIEGKFLLSSCRNARLKQYTAGNGWHTAEISMDCPMTSHANAHTKVEVLTSNFPFTVNLDGTQKKLVTKQD